MHSVEIHLISKLYIEVKRAINIYAQILVHGFLTQIYNFRTQSGLNILWRFGQISHDLALALMNGFVSARVI